MLQSKEIRGPAWLTATALLAALGGCSKAVVLNPAGDVAAQQGDLVMVATYLMLLIIVPVILATFFFAWKYRQSNTEAEYDPEFHHSTKLELLIWTAPLAIVIVLGAITWISTHKLDPYRPLDRIDHQTPLAENVTPLTVEVVAMDWKWLFFYPEQGIATVNELAAPVNRPIHFKITSTTTMNAFYVPDLAGMIYAMPGMQTELNAVINKEGVYKGLSTHYSGPGFSHMNFKFHGLTEAGFNDWIAKAKSEGGTLDRTTYLELVKPTERHPVQRFGNVDPKLYHTVLNRCVEEGQMCMHTMMAIDKAGGQSYMRAKGLNLSGDICTTEDAAKITAALEPGVASEAVIQQ
ncbi:ubiquinol oxidase subunit II [Comamonas endophytica]|uniref:Ubiquinol oxidase subunit 2 n=1 Tax=Comamonas endophytica TaxID=2949090 RepID=A0ABY6GA25_9BURK|nr:MULTISPECIES: ubiquinol oxidase subunit II [unclassified Acidovorax]MCD2511958.1 ubiquinol oxidase subunit II [Acidovorax sp. D4N7]UYG51670.1 ubiquinol oxidase subunit II [Acidovorax sp. 5MLIR]UYG51741.1 ubiquinol oxidase subunit II [Acidovorax sp. 5MLIR]